MSKMRYINTRFWEDGYISNLDPSEKLLFIYLISNSRVEICGAYELPRKIMAVETGIDRDMVEKILRRFELDGKIVIEGDWVLISNFLKHQALNPSIIEGVRRSMKKIPLEMQEFVAAMLEDAQALDSLGTDCGIPKPKPKPKPKPNKPMPTAGGQVSNSFEEFWMAFPRKVAKKRARTLWQRLAFDATTCSRILEHVRLMTEADQWTKSEGQFIPHPTTYLSQERWLSDTPRKEVEKKRAMIDGCRAYQNERGDWMVINHDGRHLKWAGSLESLEYK